MASSSSEGATLVLLGVPQGTELGIDCKSWQVGPRFRGVKMIPPGLTSSTTARQLWRTNWPEDRPLPLSQTREIILATGRQGRRSGLLSSRMKRKHERGLRFLSSPKKTYPPGATPAEITKCSMDLSYALETVLEEEPHAGGELQFAFVCFPLKCVRGLRAWKCLLRKDLYLGLIAVLYHPAGEIPPDFLLTLYLKTTSLPPRFFPVAIGKKFKAHLTKKFRWDFDSDLDDCEPVVVELPEGVTVD
uniref:Protein AAR2 homolog n=1 Tax=Maylandia zebra TaxID=106582 RepID=A0A3P9CU99_9CICH